MIRTARLMLFLGSVAAAPVHAQAAPPTVVILTFENGGSYGLDSLDFSGLGRAIPAALTAELARNPGLRTIDRGEAQRIVDRDGLSRGGRVDAAAAARVGKQLGAGYVVTGTFVDYYGRVRIDARLIDTGNGTILEVVSSGQRPRAELPQMISDIASQLMSGKRLPALAAGTAATARVSSDALVLFGRAVLAQDQGDKAAAADYYQRALKIAPDFAAAKEGLRSVQS
ncbi:MAG TPA: FlgO family outer membrane protein [Gemmatimonadales bacterium]|nr:FlgO family outer membrane protein [Gemmatimonadales bacterium]HRZ10411.1 FlgO family outer membrane protein [Gemmatimonadales bacterium]